MRHKYDSYYMTQSNDTYRKSYFESISKLKFHIFLYFFHSVVILMIHKLWIITDESSLPFLQSL